MNKKLTNKKLTNKKLTNKKLTNKKLTNKKLTNKKLTNKKLTNKKLTNKKLTNKKLTKNYVYINGFWYGFLNKKDIITITFFNYLFKNTKLKNFKIVNNINNANILFESVFLKKNSLINYKKWKYTIHYSGEPYYNNLNYDLILNSDLTNIKKNIVDLPLFVNYIYSNNLMNKLLNRSIKTTIPTKFCCFIVSNSGCDVRNKMFEMLSLYKKVDSYGKYANNMNMNIKYKWWSDEYIKFISNYKFIICFENTKIRTYSTEKIINPYLAHIIPIYWSSHHIKKIINPKSMLFLENETDKSFNKLMNKVIELDNDDKKYLEFVNRPVFTNLNYWNNNYTINKIRSNINKIIK